MRELKAALRCEIDARVRSLTEAERKAASIEAVARLQKQAAWIRAQGVLLFAPMPGELDVWPLLEEALVSGKTAALPRFDPAAKAYFAHRVADCGKDVQPGYFGIREPLAACSRLALNRLDFVLVPGVAFDAYGRRLGRGKGYYDRLLRGFPGFTCGAAFDQQVVDSVPVEAHDVLLNCILTPSRWIEVPPRAVLE